MDRSQLNGLRDKIFCSTEEKIVTACIIADEDGVIAESDAVAKEAERLGLLLESILETGNQVRAGDVLVRFRGAPQQVRTGRHKKDGVKIAVGEYNGTLIISLPGPNDEVKASLEPIVNGLKAGFEKTIWRSR
jgi:nicotinate-nucleotide pyrophosphorylase